MLSVCTGLCLLVCVRMYVRERVCERERDFVCVCVSVYLHVCVREREFVCECDSLAHVSPGFLSTTQCGWYSWNRPRMPMAECSNQ